MSIFIFVIALGIVQGLTEFLPVSSSGHLAMLENLPWFSELNIELKQATGNLLAFNVFLHVGTIIAVLLFWRKDIISITRGFFISIMQKDFKNRDFLSGVMIIIGTVPVLVVPAIKDLVESTVENLTMIAVFFIFNGFLLIATDILVRYRQKQKDQAVTNVKAVHELRWYHAILTGIFQVFAVLPGVSRSGSTISGGLISGLSGTEAVRYSFLLSIPVLLAASVLEFKDALEQPFQMRYDLILAGVIASFVAGMASLKFLVWLGRKLIFYPFGIYTLVLGILILLFLV